jgi:FtsZ-binding cell division protein ZapB
MRVSLKDWTVEIEAAKDRMLSEVEFLTAKREPLPNDSSSELIRLGNIYKPTKIPHNYLPRYAHVFDAIRHDVRNVVEIGVQTDASVKMWRDYFPKARIIGLDIDPTCLKFAGERIEILIGDQMDPSFLISVVKHIGSPIDIVIDDGLHTAEAIMTSFKYLYPSLSSYGIYAIEDIIEIPEVNAFLMDAIKAIQHWPENTPSTLWQVLREFDDNPGWFVNNTIGIEVYRFLAFIKRGFNPTTNPNFLSDEKCFRAHNFWLDRVRGAASDLAVKGTEPTRERLVEAVGFHERHAVDWYLGGLTHASWETWRAFMQRKRQSTQVLPARTRIDKLEREAENVRAQNASLKTEADALKTEAQALKTEAEALKTEAKALRGEIAALDDRLHPWRKPWRALRALAK